MQAAHLGQSRGIALSSLVNSLFTLHLCQYLFVFAEKLISLVQLVSQVVVIELLRRCELVLLFVRRGCLYLSRYLGVD